MSQMSNAIKGLVSKKKRRYKDDDFDLDLTIIRPYIIAMGYPAESLEGVYRNRIDDVVRFLDRYYADHYHIYNLCSEREYDAAKFHNQVSRFPFDDHHPPKVTMMIEFCRSAQKWLVANEKNVVVVHCKAGKGRTGVMICAFLVYAGQLGLGDKCSVLQALRDYDRLRTYNLQGVTIPSQIRYVFYFGELLMPSTGRQPLKYEPVKLFLRAVRLSSLPSYNSNGLSCPYFRVRQRRCTKPESEISMDNNEIEEVYKSEVYEQQHKKDSSVFFFLEEPLEVCGDVLIEFFNKSKMNKKERMCHLWLNTFFVVNPVRHTITERDLIEREAKADRQAAGNDPGEAQQNHVEYRERTHSTGIMGKAYLSRLSSDDQPFDVIDLPEDQSRNMQPPSGAEPCISVEFPKAYLDRAVKDKEHFPSSFSIRLYFSTPSDINAIAGPHTVQSNKQVARNGAQHGSSTLGTNLKQQNNSPIATHNISSGISLSTRMLSVNSDASMPLKNTQYMLHAAPRNSGPRPGFSSTAAYATTPSHASNDPSVQMQSHRHLGDPQAPPAVHEPRSFMANYPAMNSTKQHVGRAGSNDIVASSYAMQHTLADDAVRSPISRTNSGAYPATSTNRAPFQGGGNGHSSPSWVPHTVPQATAPGSVRYRQPSELTEHQPNVRHGYSAPAASMAGVASIKVNANGGHSVGVSSPNRVLPTTSSRGSPSTFCGANIPGPASAPSTAFINKFPPTAQPEASDDDDDRTYDDTEDDTDDTDDDEEVAESARQLDGLRVDENSNTCASKSPALPNATSTTDASGLGDVPTQNYSMTSLV